MESPNLNSTPPDDVALEVWLRSNQHLAALPDDGFTHRVVTALPRPNQSHVNRWWFSLAGLVTGGSIAVAGLISSNVLMDEAWLTTFEKALSSPTLLGALAITVCSLTYAFSNELRRIVRTCF